MINDKYIAEIYFKEELSVLELRTRLQIYGRKYLRTPIENFENQHYTERMPV